MTLTLLSRGSIDGFPGQKQQFIRNEQKHIQLRRERLATVSQTPARRPNDNGLTGRVRVGSGVTAAGFHQKREQAGNTRKMNSYLSTAMLTTEPGALLAMSKVRKKADDIWKDMPWKKFRQHVFQLQRAIFKAQKNGEKAKVKRLQKLLLYSRAAAALAVRQVTQLNSGRKTHGVDGKTALSTKERLDLCQRLHRKWNKWKHSIRYRTKRY